MLKIKNQTALPIKIDLTDVFAAIGETAADLTDAIFVIKNPDDGTDLITKTLGTGIVANPNNANELNVQLSPNVDFSPTTLQVGKKYKFYFGIRTTNLASVYEEVDFDDNRILVREDGIST